MVLNSVYLTVLTSVITSQLQFCCKHREATVIVILCYINKTEFYLCSKVLLYKGICMLGRIKIKQTCVFLPATGAAVC